MNAPASFSKPFFMTRQSANLMEDLQRQISQPGSVCLLYGAEGVGKSQLLKQFTAIRLRQQIVKHIRLYRHGYYVDEGQELQSYENLLSIFPAAPENNSIWIIDQLEQAASDVYQCLLEYWVSYANGRPLALILAGRTGCLKDLYEASRQKNVQIESVELQPFTKLESHQYLVSCLCPDAQSAVKFSQEIKRQIELTGGFPELLNQIVQRHMGIIDCNEIQAGSRHSGFFWSLALIVLVLIVGAGFTEMNLPQFTQDPHPVISEQIAGEIDLAADNAVVTKLPIVDRQAKTEKPEQPILEIQQRNNQHSTGDDIQSLADTQVMGEINDQTSESAVNPGVENNTEATAGEENLLQARLGITRDWLTQSANETASIQIMTLVQRNDFQPEKSLLRFLHKIQKQGVDTDQVYIYQKQRSSSLIYVVLFGSYADRSIAGDQLQSLPSELKGNSPIIRTVSGIKRELSNG